MAIRIDTFGQRFAQSMALGLPGQAAHQRVTSRLRMPADYDPWPPHARKSAVLILCFEMEQRIGTVLFKRTDDGGPHSGQIAFPGGKVDHSDPSLAHTALREAHEELGIDPKSVHLLGPISPLYIPVSNFAVQPFVGIAYEPPAFRPNEAEVQEVVLASFDHLFDPANHFVKRFQRDQYAFDASCIRIGQHVVWGATAIILAEVQDLYQRALHNH